SAFPASPVADHRTAGCGPACPVVWEGDSGTNPLPPIPISPASRRSANADDPSRVHRLAGLEERHVDTAREATALESHRVNPGRLALVVDQARHLAPLHVVDLERHLLPAREREADHGRRPEGVGTDLLE